MNNKTFLPFVALCLIWGSTWYFITVSVVDYNMPPIYAQFASLPATSEVVMPLPGLPLPDIPLPQKEVQCQECSAKFVVKDMRLTKTKCPICSAIVDF